MQTDGNIRGASNFVRIDLGKGLVVREFVNDRLNVRISQWQCRTLFCILPVLDIVSGWFNPAHSLGAAIEWLQMLFPDRPATVRPPIAFLEIDRVQWPCPHTEPIGPDWYVPPRPRLSKHPRPSRVEREVRLTNIVA